MLLLITVISLVAASSASECPDDPPAPCQCYIPTNVDTGTPTIDCKNLGLTEIPDFSSLRGLPLYNIDLSENQIQVVRDSAFSGITFFSHHIGLTPELVLTNNPLTRIEDEAFTGITADRLDLYMGYGLLTEFPARALGQIRNLSLLYIPNHDISDIPANSFTSFARFNILYLNGNPINSLDMQVFNGLEHSLMYLYIQHMPLTSFPTAAIKDLRLLHTLDLEGTRLESLSTPLFQGFVSRPDSWPVLLLNLRNCAIGHITQDAFLRYGNLRLYNLDLSDNLLTGIDFLAPGCDLALEPRADVMDIGLGGNPLHCDCDMLSLWKQLPYASSTAECAGPEHFTGHLLDEIIDEDQGELFQQYCPHLFQDGEFIHEEISCDPTS